MDADGLDFPPPTPSDLGDHEVPRDGDSLDGVRVALMVTGGIAAMKAPMVARALRRQGATVTAFATTEALRYVGRDALAWACDRPVVVELTADAEHLSDSISLCSHFPNILFVIAELRLNSLLTPASFTILLSSSLPACVMGCAGYPMSFISSCVSGVV